MNPRNQTRPDCRELAAFDPIVKNQSRELDWKKQLLHSYTSVNDLYHAGLVSEEEYQGLLPISTQFRVRITPYYASLFGAAEDCPIRKQALPWMGELDPKLPSWAVDLSENIYQRKTPWHPDAIGDVKHLASSRITHRYENRAIVHLSSMCAVYCRFCFRKSHLNDPEKVLYEGSLEPALEYLKSNPEISELILTGGDPLSLSDAGLRKFLQQVSEINSVKVLRIHSRMAVTLPMRFSDDLLNIFSQPWNFKLYLVSHFNHVRELTVQARKALSGLRKAGVLLLNQSVLLKGVNHKPQDLLELFQGLYEAGVIPFYLHHPDWTPGTFHFRIGIEEGRKIVSELRGKLSGPALPDYILDLPQGFGKVSLLNGSTATLLESRSSKPDKISGAVYKITPPFTRHRSQKECLYLDLYSAD